MRVTQITADLHVTDLQTAKGFYTNYLGLAEEEFNLGWLARYNSPDTTSIGSNVTRFFVRAPDGNLLNGADTRSTAVHDASCHDVCCWRD